MGFNFHTLCGVDDYDYCTQGHASTKKVGNHYDIAITLHRLCVLRRFERPKRSNFYNGLSKHSGNSLYNHCQNRPNLDLRPSRYLHTIVAVSQNARSGYRSQTLKNSLCTGITRTAQKQIHLNKKIWLTRSLLVGQFNNTKQDKRPTKSGVHNIGLNVARQRFQNGTQAIEYNSRLYSNNAAARRSCVVSELWATSVVTEWWTSRCSNTYSYFTIKTKFSDFASTKSCPKDRFFRILATYVGFWKYKKLFIVVIKKFVSTIWAIPLTWCCPQLDFKQKFGAHTHSSCAPQN